MTLRLRGFAASGAWLLFVCQIVLASPARAVDAPRSADYPDDPFAWERETVRSTETGSGRGQTHFTALGALVSGKNSDAVYFGGQLCLEFQLHEFGAVRISGFQDLVEGDGSQLAHKFSSVRVGPALHLRPYRRIDLGPFAEGGMLVVDAVDARGAVIAPEVTLGGFIAVHLNSYLFLQLELERAWSNAKIDGVFGAQDRTAAMAGLGVVF